MALIHTTEERVREALRTFDILYDNKAHVEIDEVLADTPQVRISGNIDHCRHFATLFAADGVRCTVLCALMRFDGSLVPLFLTQVEVQSSPVRRPWLAWLLLASLAVGLYTLHTRTPWFARHLGSAITVLPLLYVVVCLVAFAFVAAEHLAPKRLLQHHQPIGHGHSHAL